MLEPSAPTTPCLHCGGVLNALNRCQRCGASSQVKDLTLEKVLSQQAHSRVYVGRSALGARVAVKELVFSMVPEVQQLDAFYREVGFLKSLHHPQTPEFIEAFSVGEGVQTRLYLVQEFIEGQSLLQRLQHTRVTGAAFDDVALQALKVLIALHSRTPKIIHRDLKPANIMFRPNGQLVLVDFGSARHLDKAATYGSTMVGTFGYMSAEQLGGTVDDASDLHGLGASLLHAASGKAPAEFISDGMHLKFGDLAGLTPKQNAFLKKLTAPTKSERFASAQEAREWFEAEYQAIPLAKPPQRARVLGMAVVALAVMSGLAWLGLGDGQRAGGLSPDGVKPIHVVLPVPAEVGPPSPPTPPLPALDPALVKEARNTLNAYWVAQRGFFAEKDVFTANLNEVFVPDPWCPDGARSRLADQPLPGEVVGCHFFYGAHLKGTGPLMQLTLYARGAVHPLLPYAWSTSTEAARPGIVDEVPIASLFALLGVQRALPAAPATTKVPGPPQDDTEKELLEERLKGLAAIRAAELTSFAATDVYSADLAAIRYSPDPWCPDGARLKLPLKPRTKEVTGCHYFYGAMVEGVPHENQTLSVYARGAIGSLMGKVWLMTQSGPLAGVPQELTTAAFDALVKQGATGQGAAPASPR